MMKTVWVCQAEPHKPPDGQTESSILPTRELRLAFMVAVGSIHAGISKVLLALSTRKTGQNQNKHIRMHGRTELLVTEHR